MLKRTAILIGLLSLCLVATVSSFSKAHVNSKAKMQIAKPQNALIATKNLSVTAEDGSESGIYKVKVTNHLATKMEIISVECIDKTLDGFIQFQFDKYMRPGEWQKVRIILSSDFPEAFYGKTIEFQLKADWQDGEAEVNFEVPIEKPASLPAPLTDSIHQAPNDAENIPVVSAKPTEQPIQTPAEAGE